MWITSSQLFVLSRCFVKLLFYITAGSYVDGKEQREESVILFFSIMMMCDSQRRFVLLALLKSDMVHP